MRQEAILIRKIKAGDQDALPELYNLYRPLINHVKQQYYVRYYDEQDWNQEALIVCHEAALKYQEGKGTFGSYYKVRLLNRVRSVLRYHMAYRRRASTQAISLETAITNGLKPVRRPAVLVSCVPLSESVEEAISNLSLLEIWTLLIILGVYRQEEVINYLKVSQLTIVRARSLLISKMRSSLLK